MEARAQRRLKMSEEKIRELEEKIARGEFRFGETLKLKHFKKIRASKEARENLKKASVADHAKLYAYILSLEKRLEALEELVMFKGG